LSLDSGERQVAPNVDGIRRDHVARYEFALTQIEAGSKVLDLACGVGYGSDILAKAGHTVTGIDVDGEAIAYAKEHYAGNGAEFIQASAENIELTDYDVVVCFETIEHIKHPMPLLRGFRSAAPKLIASVPNEEIFPYKNYKFHFRHYTKQDFIDLLCEAGWGDCEWFGQTDHLSDVEPDINGRTLIAVANHIDPVRAKNRPPEHVSIVGLGPSSAAYLDLAKRLGDRRVYCDEVWGINAISSVIQCDRVFHMDDVKVQEGRAKLKPDGNIAAMVNWLKTYPGPVYTSVVREGYPGLVEYPLEAVLNGEFDAAGGVPYFNSTTAYAIAYAIHIGVKQISLFGIDYTLANMHSAEQGRACCEFWLGIAAARGIEVHVPEQSSLMDACVPERERLYGYDLVDVSFADREDGGVTVFMEDREDQPTAEEIEARYDHTKHPNQLMRKEAT